MEGMCRLLVAFLYTDSTILDANLLYKQYTEELPL